MKKILLLLVLALKLNTFAQEKDLQNHILEKSADYVSNLYPEKVYLHTDKTYYKPEDNLWFSVYLLNGITHTLSKKSTIIYTELINDKDSIVSEIKTFAENINNAGNFSLPKNIKPGKYKLRSYTNYMRNYDTVGFYKKEIIVIPKLENNDSIAVKDAINFNLKNTKKLKKPEVYFYPEGGYLVNGLKSKVVLKIPEYLVEDTPASVKIINSNGEMLSSFETKKFGLGEFFLIPKAKTTYKAVVSFKSKEFEYNLPNALPIGYTLNVVGNKKDVYVNLQSNYDDGLLNSTVVIHERGKLIYSTTIKTSEKNKTLKIPVNKLENGVVTVTLFTNEGKPFCERLLYVDNPKNIININIKKPKDYFVSRRKVNLEVAVTDNENKNIISNFSITVKNSKSSPNTQNSENIKTWLLLNSDIKGKIKNPNYFFENKNDFKRSYLLDLILLTNGWRRFTWQQFLNDSTQTLTHNVEKGFIISGKTLMMKAPHSGISVPTRLTFLGNSFQQEPIKVSDEEGKFSYGPFIYFDTIPILLEARLTNFKSTKNRDRKVLITKDAPKKRAKIYKDTLVQPKKHFQLNDLVKEYVEYENDLLSKNPLFKESTVLDEIVITADLKTKEEIREQEMRDRTSYGTTFRRFDVESNVTIISENIMTIFYEIPGVTIRNDTLYVRRRSIDNPALILVDEMPMDIEDVKMMQASEVSFIDVLDPTESALFSSNSAVISIYTKTGDGVLNSNDIQRKPGVIDFKTVGFYTAKEFYNTDHEEGIEEKTKADTRTTLYWNPQIKTSLDKDTELSFFTADGIGNYIIEIQGITSTGIPFFETSEIFVE